MNNKKEKRKSSQEQDGYKQLEQDEHFYFIAGYTDGGIPYGITWEEYENESLNFQQMGKGEQMKELKLSEEQMKELVETYDMHVDGIDFFLNIETGEIVTLNSFDPDDEDEELSEIIDEGYNEVYFRVPYRESHEGYSDMSDFAETVVNEEIRTKLVHVLNGSKKIFRKFKDTLASDEQELERYYQFVEVRNRERVIQWLESEGFRLQVK